jgi:hypothetical protein
MSLWRLRALLVLLVSLAGPEVVRAQGKFGVQITGVEFFRGSPSPVSGGGDLQLDEGTTLSYSIYVPVKYVFPREAHFHGPMVGGETPIISLVPYIQDRDGIRYSGSAQIPAKFHPDLMSGKWYINLHATDYETGVLGGFIVPVPEPCTSLILGAGWVMALFWRRPRTA